MSEPGPSDSEPSLFDDVDEAADRDAEARADADVAEGRVVSNARVIEWLRSWGTPDRAPTPYSWRK